jgi:2-oxoglutarate ferredoxin oxidoreductase subunit alpha
LIRKIRDHADDLVDVVEDYTDDADVVVVSYGITSRIAKTAVEDARARGMRVGHLRLRIAWPFPATRIRELSKHVKTFIMPELNMGQMVIELERAATAGCRVVSLPHAGGSVHEPEGVLRTIIEVSQ